MRSTMHPDGTRFRSTIAAVVAAVGLAVLATACGADRAANPDPTASAEMDSTSASVASSAASSASSNDSAPNLVVGPLPSTLDPLAAVFSKHVDVWGVSIVATGATADADVLHAANVMAQYLDNDADGSPDDPAVVEAMVANGATLLMAATPDEFESLPSSDLDAVFDAVGAGGQDLYGSETNPADGFDASLEEVHHLILNTGWSTVHPDRLGVASGTSIADAMDLARGGRFDAIPDAYPDGAWFTYDDRTCDYRCMVTEYAYWAHTGLLGGQVGRADEIGHEWRLVTPEQVRSGDPAATAVFTDPTLGLPTMLPDGNYPG